MRFQSPETGKWYICLYPLDENDEEVEIQAFAFEEPTSEEDELELLPIENDAEWEMVQEVLTPYR